ncbi:MAG TPA: DNA recombination protein RmuC [Phycisphaerae bacterium]|jgi:DNA recombination protein RmuC|nr:DNA recombination protein RmuC [Phycisphaerae bacterium]
MDLWLGMMLVAGGAALGAAGVALLAQRRRGAEEAELQSIKTEFAVAQERAGALEAEVCAVRGRHDAAVAAAEGHRGQLSAAQARVASLEAQLEASRRNVEEQARLLDDANERLTASFAAVSREALEKSNAAFLQMAEAKFKTLSSEAAGTLEARKAQIGVLLKPLEEMLKTYQVRLGELEAQRTDAYAALRQQIGVMSATQAALSTQTGQLISALTKPSVRGQWGEVALRRLVELAGMTARCDFTEQFITGGSTDEARLRPDMVVHMPADRDVVVDCKTVLAAFLDAAAAADEAARQQHLRRHATLVRNRAKELASKAYWSQFDQMPEFVVLFLPGESFLYAACEHDTSLIEDCMQSRVILATPTTLIALLKSIEYGWRQQAVSKNAEEIRRLGIELYERLATLAENMGKVGASLEGAVEAYNRTVGTLESRVLVSARKMGELGARTEKDVADVEPVEKQIRTLATSLFE